MQLDGSTSKRIIRSNRGYSAAYESYRICLGAEEKLQEGRRFETLVPHLQPFPALSVHLKIDTEGSEWTVLDQLMDSSVKDRIRSKTARYLGCWGRTLDMEVHFGWDNQGNLAHTRPPVWRSLHGALGRCPRRTSLLNTSPLSRDSTAISPAQAGCLAIGGFMHDLYYIDLCRFHAGGLPRRLESQGVSETLGGAWRCPFGCPFCRTAPGAFVPSRPSTCLAASQWPVLSCRAPNAPSMLRTTENLIVFHDALHMLYM